MNAVPRKLVAAVAVVLWSVLAPVSPARADEGEAISTVSEALTALIASKDDAGRPVLTEETREQLAALPTRVKSLLDDAVANEMITSAEHIATILGAGFNSDKLEIVLSDNCFLCHTDYESQGPDQLFSLDPAAQESPLHLNLRNYASDVHLRDGISCAGCHGGDPHEDMGHDFPPSWPTSQKRRTEDRSWIPEFCGGCHADAAVMQRLAPKLPTDQLSKFRTSRHGLVLMDGKDSRAAQCLSCHGVHGILSPSNPLSSTHPTNVAATCGTCHSDAEVMKGFVLADGTPVPTDQVEEYRGSVHDRALMERGDLAAATCNDCHGGHTSASAESGVASYACRSCHAANAMLFDGSNHKDAFDKHGWSECVTCHGNHDISKTSDSMLDPSKSKLCVSCHDKFSTPEKECSATAEKFFLKIASMSAAAEQAEHEIERLAKRGLDVEPMEAGLERLGDALKRSRSTIHAFDRDRFAEIAGEGDAVAAEMAGFIDTAREDYKTRRLELYGSILMIGLLMLLIYIRLRAWERDNGRPGA